MATFFTGDVGGIDLSAFDLAAITSGTPTTMSDTVYRLPNAEFQGGNFTYTGNSLTGGTITAIIVFSGGDEAYRITNLNLLVSAVDAFVATNDSQGFLGAVFSGKDIMDGSESADHLIGYADDDTIDGNGGNDTLDGGTGNDRVDGGAGNDSLLGNEGNDTLDGATGGDDSMDGGAGSDVYFVDSTKDVTKDSGPAPGTDFDTVISSVDKLTIDDSIENLTLANGVVTGTGNAGANKLLGNDLANTLDCAAGADALKGGKGDDTYIVDNTGDQIIENVGEGSDTVKSSVTFTLAANVEKLTLTGADSIDGVGNDLNNTIIGNGADNKLEGLANNDSLSGVGGNDTLDGGLGNDRLDGGAGDDTMVGDAGNDTYVIDAYTDIVNETGKDTGDTVETSVADLHIDLTLPDFMVGIENVTFTGKEDLNATGTAINNVLTGNDGDNQLLGNDGNDTLIGGGGKDTLTGGKGTDSMAGGTGNDVYDVDIAGDKILEDKNAGVDVVRSTINYILGANLEALVLIGGNLNGTGNDLPNAINGTDGNNILDGKGSADILEGMGGDDTYLVDDAADEIDEEEGAAGGHDTAKSTVDYVLGDNVEDLVLIGGFHTNGTGNKLNNLLIGNAAFNKLDGGLGADTYMIDNASDKADETGGSGLNDTAVFVMTDPLDEQAIADKFAAQLIGGVLTSKLIVGVEHYDFVKFTTDVHLNIAGDNAANRIIATKFTDTLTGNGGNDTLDGGLGIDSLTSGLGNDTYVIDTLDDKSN